MACADRAGRDARGHAIYLFQLVVVDAVDAQRAFLHHADVFVELAGAVRAGPGAQLAADAEGLVDQHDAVLGALEGGAGRAHRHARRLLAMQARFREMHGAAVRAFASLEAVDAVEPDAGGRVAPGLVVGQRRHVAAAVPFLAIDRAGVAANADVEVDDEAELAVRGVRRQRGHGRPRRARNSAPYARSPPGFGSLVFKGSKLGAVSPASSAAHLRRRTLRSYHAACPVTGSMLA